MVTKREHLVQMLRRASNFYLSKWVREGHPANSEAAFIAGLQAMEVSQDPNPELDKQIVEGESAMRISLVKRRS